MQPLDGAAEVRRIIDLGEEVLPRLSPLSADEFLSLELPARELVLAPILPQQGLMLLHAYRGIAKTLLALGIGYCIACGSQLLGWSAPKPRRVLYLDGEMPAKTMQARLAATVAGTDVEPPDPSFFTILSADVTVDGLPDLASDNGQKGNGRGYCPRRCGGCHC
jgi:putative DNA primase/helicase